MALASLSSSQNLYLVGLTFGALFISLFFIAFRWARTHRANESITLRSRMGQGRWEFSQSFATNLTVIGSVLTVLLSSTGRVVTRILPNGAYGGLAAFFGIVVVIAPLLYNGTAVKVTVAPDQFDTAAEYHGTVWGFLLAALVIAWGLIGSISTAFVVLLELEYGGSLSLASVVLLALALFSTLIFFGRYLWVKIDGTIIDQLDPAAKTARASRSAKMRATLGLPAPTDVHPAPSPQWTLF